MVRKEGEAPKEYIRFGFMKGALSFWEKFSRTVFNGGSFVLTLYDSFTQHDRSTKTQFDASTATIRETRSKRATIQLKAIVSIVFIVFCSFLLFTIAKCDIIYNVV